MPKETEKTKDLETTIDPQAAKKEAKLSKYEDVVQRFVDKRIQEMKEYRKSLKIEEKWKDADQEYIPGKVEFGSKGKRWEEDQLTGKRSRLVPIGGDDAQKWRSDNADPTLLAKIQTALSIIIDRNPEAMLTALEKKHEATTDLAYSLWKRNWEVTNSKEVLKLFCFNLAKYGWACGRSFPRIIKYNKSVLVELDDEDPSKNKYEEREYVAFNDVARQNLDPYRVWMDEMTVPFDRFSMNDCYYEIDYSYDAAKGEFGMYKNWEFVNRSSKVVTESEDSEDVEDKEKMQRKDIITIGFYENRMKDLFCIYIPTQKLPLYCAPLPNDEGNLSIWQSMWILRSATSPYGVSLWEIIRNDKELYDKMSNMTMDQLTLSIMKMIFYKGSNTLLGDGKIKIVPGKFEQIVNGEVEFLEIPTPGMEAWEGLKVLKQRMDDNSGITPTLEGAITGKTLGEILHAKESSLKRLKVPLENISEAIEQDAYLTLSWMSQIYSTPEVKEFTSLEQLIDYEKESGTVHDELFEQNAPEGEIEGYQATFLPSLSLHLEDSEGKLFESKDSKFFQVGKDIKPKDLKWRGIFRVIPKSLLSPSVELEKQRKMEMFNVIAPLLAQPPQIYSKAVQQVIKVNEEDPEDWLPDSWLMEEEANPLFVDNPMMQPQIDPVTGQPVMPTDGGQSMQAAAGVTPAQGSPTVVPQGDVSGPSVSQLTGGGMPSLTQ